MRVDTWGGNRDTCIVTTDRYDVFFRENAKDLHEDAIFDAIDEACALKSFDEYGIIKSYGDV